MEKVKYTKARGLIAARKYSVKPATIEKWANDGNMPAKYAGVDTEGYKIDGVSLFDLRVARFKNQTEFIDTFNKQFGLSIAQVHLSNWERGKNQPSKVYQKYLREFFSSK